VASPLRALPQVARDAVVIWVLTSVRSLHSLPVSFNGKSSHRAKSKLYVIDPFFHSAMTSTKYGLTGYVLQSYYELRQLHQLKCGTPRCLGIQINMVGRSLSLCPRDSDA